MSEEETEVKNPKKALRKFKIGASIESIFFIILGVVLLYIDIDKEMTCVGALMIVGGVTELIFVIYFVTTKSKELESQE